jgi:predicted ATP-grasp superfamily ATP-dependent carboligase
VKIDTSTPVVVLHGYLASLAIMRTLGPLGVPLYGVDGNPDAPALRSKYCRESFIRHFDENRPGPYLDTLLAIGRRLGKAILIPTSDELTQFMSDNAAVLREYYRFQDNRSPTSSSTPIAAASR